ncbi:MAG: serpin family protein [Methanothrix sp.]|nr:serpin family protein [Methanothrix sp.]
MKAQPAVRAFFIFLFTVAFSGCVHDPGSPGSEDADEIRAQLTADEKVAASSNRFALDMYHELAMGQGNVFFSPWSLTCALSMAGEGANASTADEIRSVLHSSGDNSAWRQTFLKLDTRFNARSSGYQLTSANAIWVDSSFPLDKGYAALIERYYHARAENLDLKDEIGTAREAINNWVGSKTAGKIKDLIAEGYINPETRLILTNAIYFNGTWIKAFDSSRTRDGNFFKEGGGTVAVPMMSRTDQDAIFDYMENEDVQMLRMPYAGGNVSMLIILPKGNDSARLESLLSAEEIEKWRSELVMRRVDIYIPRFKLESSCLLKKTLADLGMPTAFSGTADFSGMSSGRMLFISEVIHKAYADVNEQGTEAAAATAVIMAESASNFYEPATVFRADHPFLFLIEDRQTGCILFMGRLSDPAAA